MRNGPELPDFEGTWSLSRGIEDRAAGERGSFEGKAVFAPDGIGLTCRESGLLYLSDRPPLQAERVYLWRSGRDGIEVRFADGRDFHVIDLGDRPVARHDCDPDIYNVAYDFTHWPAWSAVWTVTGPRKDYTMTSRFTPIED